jgi:imidazole glycerol-phosphate synthase subunit HisH
MEIAIIKYNAGNIRSVDFALQRMGIEAVVTNDAEKIKKADKVIFPGVGEASTTMKFLRENKIDVLLRDLKQPVLGICLGLQLMCQHSEEGDTPCIGIFDAKVKLFTPAAEDKSRFKVPHMGWNDISQLKNGIFDPSIEGQYVYFVHSYYAEITSETAARSQYVVPFSAALHKDNYYATQFHPEKSGPVGAKILKNFIEL